MKFSSVISDSVPANSNNRRIDLRARCCRNLGFLVRAPMDGVAVLLLRIKLNTVVTSEGILRECQPSVTHSLVSSPARNLKTARSVIRNLPEAICYGESKVALSCGTHFITRNPVARFVNDRTSVEGENRCQRQGQATFMHP